MADQNGGVSKVEPALAIILAAGKSTRMKSALPKVVHEICGRPMVEYVIDAVRAAGGRRIVLVVGHAADTVRGLFGGQPGIEFALQAEQRGTGHAVMMCREHLAGVTGPVLVLNGDIPLVKSASLVGLLADLSAARAACVIGSAVTDANEGLGRIVRDAGGAFLRIVEHKDATPAELQSARSTPGAMPLTVRLCTGRWITSARITSKRSTTSPIARVRSKTRDERSSPRPVSIFARRWGSTRVPSSPTSSDRSSATRSNA
jgi:bifunctional N-acetylglucosamine-1-phosphate-uridyltransferase/glucosamine-1-phosphate-acetyltransferase GlmU-like protein